MGRRVTSTTKGGKFMNPTDQARKEARRRELRKNKKQRLAVRQAVIKTKDPRQMLAELDTLDEMELNPSENLPYNDKVVKEKRIKLLENIQRITQYYLREDPEQGAELKLLVDNYRKDRLKKEVYYESVRNAQKVTIDSIPLPDAPFQTPQLSDIPLPGIQPQGILKKNPTSVGFFSKTERKKDPPGPPPGPPPLKKRFKGNTRFLYPRPPPGTPSMEKSIDNDKDAYDPEEGPILGDVGSDSDEEEIAADHEDAEKSDDEFYHRDDDLDDSTSGGRKRVQSRDGTSDNEDGRDASKHARLEDASGITPLQAMMLKLAGQSVPTKDSNGKVDAADSDIPSKDVKNTRFSETQQKPPPGPPPGLPPGPPRLPPDVATGRIQGRMLPPGPPPGHPPTLPPGPPPGLPPTMPIRMGMMPSIRQQIPERFNRSIQAENPINNANVLSAPPSLIQHRQEKEKEGMPAMIVAKPKIINNPKADVTRFMPTSIRVKRQTTTKIGPNRPTNVSAPSSSDRNRQEKNKKGKLNADVAYDSFMKEMQGFL
uniref:WW domain-binding protein 11-like n=1 Tax=Styela clava TaxID=7725 RepID=UPI00193A8B50|nr:WW domain-binding protein 11-like [Styela clava]